MIPDRCICGAMTEIECGKIPPPHCGRCGRPSTDQVAKNDAIKTAAGSVLFHFWNCDASCGRFRHSMAVLASAVGYETYPGQANEIAAHLDKNDHGYGETTMPDDPENA